MIDPHDIFQPGANDDKARHHSLRPQLNRAWYRIGPCFFTSNPSIFGCCVSASDDFFCFLMAIGRHLGRHCSDDGGNRSGFPPEGKAGHATLSLSETLCLAAKAKSRGRKRVSESFSTLLAGC